MHLELYYILLFQVAKNLLNIFQKPFILKNFQNHLLIYLEKLGTILNLQFELHLKNCKNLKIPVYG
jgi:hypothetical protein